MSFRSPLLLIFLILLSFAAEAAPKYWTWADYSPRRDWDRYFAQLKETGVGGVILQSQPEGFERVAPLAARHGITLYAWVWVMNNRALAPQHPEWLDYNRAGESLAEKPAYVNYYKFLSPAIPEACDSIVAQIERIARIDGVQGVSLDYCRYVDQILPTSLWPKYGIVQDKEYAEWDYGYHPAMLAAFEKQYGYDPSRLEDPSQDSVWLQFRLDKVTDVANRLAAMAHRYGKTISASPFPTPEMSRRMVRQDWAAWKLDLVFPMIYHGFYYGDPAWIAGCVRDCRRDKPGTPIYCGLFVPDMSRSAGDGKYSLTECCTAALEAGAEGIALFKFENLTAEQRAELKTFIAAHP